MEGKDKRYDLVPGKGKVLNDGTWWTNATVRVGFVSTTHHYYRKVETRKLYTKPNVSKCIEVGTFGGHQFARWKKLEPPDWTPCILYTNQRVEYEEAQP